MKSNYGHASRLQYVLITPARNEARTIELTLQSVVRQTLTPVKWIIVSDGSTDGTDEIVKKYSQEHSWIQLVRRPERAERHFAGKVRAFNEGYTRVKAMDYDIIGNLDADISFEPHYFEFLTGKFADNPRLGVAGTPFREGGEQYDYRFTSIEHVSGACQLFRRQCFEEIGGYVPIQDGGIDLVAVMTARMKGWQTRSFPEKICEHHRSMGTANHGKFKVHLKGGRRDYVLGVHPLWEVVRSLYQMTQRPFIIRGGLLLCGFVWALLTRAERPVSQELVAFRRQEQMRRLKQFFRSTLGMRLNPASAAAGMDSRPGQGFE